MRSAASRASGGFEPKVPVAKWLEAGVQVDRDGLEELPATLVELDAGDLRLGLRNFYVITRYNRSAMYATAVHDLSQALRARAPKPAAHKAGK
jgi:membrane-bound lytic murein transglycosylase B